MRRWVLGRNQHFDAARDAGLAADEALAFEGENHLVDGRRGDAEAALDVGFGGRPHPSSRSRALYNVRERELGSAYPSWKPQANPSKTLCQGTRPHILKAAPPDTPRSDDSRPPSKAAVVFLRQTDVPYAASAVSPKSFTLFTVVLVAISAALVAVSPKSFTLSMVISAALVAVSLKSFTCSLRTWICD